VKCPECGYVYQIKDRTVEEVYGELREITQGVEYENQARFARRCKLSRHVIARYIKQKDLATYGPRRLIKIKEGLARVERLRAKYETQRAFAKRVGISQGVIHALTKRGLPKAANGEIYIEDGLAWLRREGLLDKDGMYIKQMPQSMPGFDNQNSFAKRIGVTKETLRNLIKKGLPINEHRLIPIDAAMQWLKREGLVTADGEYIRPNVRSTPGFDNRSNFAKRLGADIRTIDRLIDEGLPINERRLIPVEAALQWLRHKGLLTKEGKYLGQYARGPMELRKRRRRVAAAAKKEGRP